MSSHPHQGGGLELGFGLILALLTVEFCYSFFSWPADAAANFAKHQGSWSWCSRSRHRMVGAAARKDSVTYHHDRPHFKNRYRTGKKIKIDKSGSNKANKSHGSSITTATFQTEDKVWPGKTYRSRERTFRWKKGQFPRFTEPYPLGKHNITGAVNFGEFRHLFPDNFTNMSMSSIGSGIDYSSITTPSQVSSDLSEDSFNWDDTNQVFAGDESSECRAIKIRMYKAQVFRDSMRPFFFKFPLRISFGNKVVKAGMTLYSEETFEKPQVDWDPEDKLYMLILTGLDSATKVFPANREVVNWLVVNIPGNNLYLGDEVVPYNSPDNVIESHRYVFFLYEQRRGFMRFPSFPIVGLNQQVMRETFALTPVAGLHFYNYGTIISEKDFGKQIRTGPLSSSDSDEGLDRVKKLTREIFINVTRWSREAGHDLSGGNSKSKLATRNRALMAKAASKGASGAWAKLAQSMHQSKKPRN